MSRRPEITVVIPTHNRVGYLKEAVASVLGQQGPVAEVIVVDDGSSDATPDWLDQLRHDRLTWLRLTPGRGGSAARNLALERCESAFTLFLDDDDRLRPGALARLCGALRAHPRAAGAAGSFVRFGPVDVVRRELQPRIAVTVPVWREELFGWNMPPGTLLWRTDAVRHIGGWDDTLSRCEDRDLNLRAYPRPFVLLPATVMEYRMHAAQVPGHEYADVLRQVLARFVGSLAGRDRQVAERVLEARQRFAEGLDRYMQGDFRAATRNFSGVLSGGTTLPRSPILGPWLLGLAAKAAAGAALPMGVATIVQRGVRGRRPPGSPVQETVVESAP